MAAHLNQWITFDASKPIETSSQSFEDWLNDNKPSKENSGVSWISVRGKSNNPDDNVDTTAIEEEWKETPKYDMDYDTIKALAVKYKHTSGKWLFHVKTGEEADEVWRNVATEIVNNELNGSSTAAKISPRNPSQAAHAVCIYSKDFTDEMDVRDLEKAIRNAGIKHVLRYKPDIFTTCGVYANNARNFGLNKSVIFVSTYNKQTRKSTIKNIDLSLSIDERSWDEQGEIDGGETDEDETGEIVLINCKIEVDQGWITYDAKTSTIEFKDWLDQTKPSQVSSQNGVNWICVRGESNNPNSIEDISGLNEEWKEIQIRRDRVRFETLKELAIRFNHTGGKWLFHVETGADADEAWRIVATQVIENEFHGTSSLVKISSRNPSGGTHVICIYNEDFTRESDVLSLETAIRGAGIKYTLRYKPDIYTTCGIYANNARKFGLKKPVVFISEYNENTRTSKRRKC